jgi:preprotein translocase subunit SecF
MFVITYRKYFFAFSALLLLSSLFAIFAWGLKPGIDFTGGALIEVSYEGGRPDVSAVRQALAGAGNTEALVQETGDAGLLVRTKDLTEVEHQTILTTLSLNGSAPVTEKRFATIGPVISGELRTKSFTSIALVSLLIILFITFAFRGISEPVKSWKYGLIAIATLVHDVLIPTGLFAVLGKLYGVEVDTLFVTALLAILGISVSDTIVVFDRIRENLKDKKGGSFAQTVGESLQQTLTRSINTSATSLLAILALFFFGPESVRTFALVLATGMVFGTYSSIFVASPLLVEVERLQKLKKK